MIKPQMAYFTTVKAITTVYCDATSKCFSNFASFLENSERTKNNIV